MAKIVIDPGHGGFKNVGDSSWNNAVGPKGTLEKTLTLDIGTRIHDQLAKRGHDVVLTRSSDNNLGLAARARVARSKRADVFVSVHLNGSTKHNAQGTETLVHTNYSNASAKLSLKVQDEVLKATKLKDRNKSYHPSRIKPQALGVLNPSRHYAHTAACLVEASFLDRAKEEARLRKIGYRKKIAKAVCNGIEAYLGSRLVAEIAAGGDAQDTIDVAAASAGKSAVSFLGLDANERSRGKDPDASERELPVRYAFSAAFVNGSLSDDVLFETLASDGDDYLKDFRQFLQPLGLRHFSPGEVLFLGSSHSGSGACGGLNEHPPRELWDNIAATIQMLDEIRHRLGAPIRITSGYRNRAYNKCVKGKPGSRHKKFMAIDFTAGAGTPEIWRRIADDVRSTEKRCRGGIGKYISRNFVHIDTRGTNTDWVEK